MQTFDCIKTTQSFAMGVDVNYLFYNYRAIFAYTFCLISIRLFVYNQSGENKVPNIESALHNELSLKI